jgi:hypothetical protein
MVIKRASVMRTRTSARSVGMAVWSARVTNNACRFKNHGLLAQKLSQRLAQSLAGAGGAATSAVASAADAAADRGGGGGDDDAGGGDESDESEAEREHREQREWLRKMTHSWARYVESAAGQQDPQTPAIAAYVRSSSSSSK